MGLRPLAYWDCGFESCRQHWCLRVASVVCCQVEVSASGADLSPRRVLPTVMCLSMIYKTSTMSPGPTGDVVEPWTSKLLPNKLFRDEGSRDDSRNATLLLRSDAFCCHVYKAMNIHIAIFALGSPYMRICAQLGFVWTHRLLLQSCSFRETLVPVRHPTRCAITQIMTISTCRTFINHREVWHSDLVTWFSLFKMPRTFFLMAASRCACDVI